ncbi:hypothetical protein FQN57_004991 [Myotisia sp. PD_48]|nr:hypothetical protein FQN57_004991 [Myotisia sp. PD_48]
MVKLENGDTAEGADAKLPKHAETPSVREHVPKHRFRRIFSTLLRLFIWYALFTAVFRCPSSISELGSDSSPLCRPYLSVRSHIEPHISPYYRHYGAPYVEVIQPYIHTFHDEIYTPVSKITKKGYNDFAAPTIQRAVESLDRRWYSVVSPHLEVARTRASDQYAQFIEPHLKSAQAIVGPPYRWVVNHGSILVESYLIPGYIRLRPVLEAGYSLLRDFMMNTVVPYNRKAFSAIISFLNSTVRTHVTKLYSKNVEPQLIKIGAKLATYRERRKSQITYDHASTIPSILTTVDIPTPVTNTKAIHIEPTSALTTMPTKKSISAQEVIAKDLKMWQEKFAIAADKGCDDLEERIAEIVKLNYNDEVIAEAEQLLSSLNEVSRRALDSLKSKFITIVKSIPSNPNMVQEEHAQNMFSMAVITSSDKIRESAHAVRVWFRKYENELVDPVYAATDTTLDVLDSIRDLGLQEMGMRWAWMDGVTYKDWEKYHALRKQFSEWRDEVHDVGMRNGDFLKARDFGNSVIVRGMEIAKDSAKQLSDIRKAGILKIQAGDWSEGLDLSQNDVESLQERKSSLRRQSATDSSSVTTPEPSSEPETTTALVAETHSTVSSESETETQTGENSAEPTTPPSPTTHDEPTGMETLIAEPTIPHASLWVGVEAHPIVDEQATADIAEEDMSKDEQVLILPEEEDNSPQEETESPSSIPTNKIVDDEYNEDDEDAGYYTTHSFDDPYDYYSDVLDEMSSSASNTAQDAEVTEEPSTTRTRRMVTQSFGDDAYYSEHLASEAAASLASKAAQNPEETEQPSTVRTGRMVTQSFNDDDYYSEHLASESASLAAQEAEVTEGPSSVRTGRWVTQSFDDDAYYSEHLASESAAAALSSNVAEDENEVEQTSAMPTESEPSPTDIPVKVETADEQIQRLNAALLAAQERLRLHNLKSGESMEAPVTTDLD